MSSVLKTFHSKSELSPLCFTYFYRIWLHFYFILFYFYPISLYFLLFSFISFQFTLFSILNFCPFPNLLLFTAKVTLIQPFTNSPTIFPSIPLFFIAKADPSSIFRRHRTISTKTNPFSTNSYTFHSKSAPQTL